MSWDPDKVRIHVARDLREIERLWRALPDELEHRAYGRDVSGLDALNLSGPVANLEAWEHRFETAESHGQDTTYASDQTAELHPLLVLATWEDVVRDERDQPTDLRATVPRAASYLRNSIDWMLSTDEDGDAVFLAVGALARELTQCRRMLEDVMSDGERADVSRVWCIAEANHPEGERVRLHFRAGAVESLDRWTCPECNTAYDYGEYISAQKVNLHAEGADRSVLVTTAREAADVPKATMDSWIARDKVKTERNEKGRVVVWWPDVREAESERQRIKRERAIRRGA